MVASLSPATRIVISLTTLRGRGRGEGAVASNSGCPNRAPCVKRDRHGGRLAAAGCPSRDSSASSCRFGAGTMPAREPKQKIAVLGGGLGSLSTVYGLTSQPGWDEKYDITVYQMGWRLGGKGA